MDPESKSGALTEAERTLRGTEGRGSVIIEAETGVMSL